MGARVQLVKTETNVVVVFVASNWNLKYLVKPWGYGDPSNADRIVQAFLYLDTSKKNRANICATTRWNTYHYSIQLKTWNAVKHTFFPGKKMCADCPQKCTGPLD